MELVRLGLLLLAAMWAMQIAAAWVQMRYYRDTVRRTAQQWHSGYLGVGTFKRRLGPGAVAIVVIDSADEGAMVREALSMSGLSVFARFKPRAELRNGPAGDFARRLAAARLAPGAKRALANAFEIACRTASERARAAPPPAL
ncbi:transcriptional regulator GutM [Paraburkholderia sp. J41]|uniref:transcriptional regulator GutM n=1 Tax=Paraburkholderia sp. J41 TaxID=2805433 RepID=UPI002AC33E59|nr:transcriptional regulator GutM [Paraburkholderia sp. J41]